MRIFSSEADLVSTLDRLDALVLDCALARTTYEQFCELYGYPYGEYALDGHESDEEELAWLAHHAPRIELHRRVTDEILHQVCSAENGKLDSYRQAGRFGPAEAQRRLREIAGAFFPGAVV